MAEQSYYLVEVNMCSVQLTTAEVAYRCGVHPELLERFVNLGLIDFVGHNSSGETLFSDEVVSLVKRILRLHNDLGVNYAGIGVILELLARIDELEERIREFERGMDDSD